MSDTRRWILAPAAILGGILLGSAAEGQQGYPVAGVGPTANQPMAASSQSMATSLAAETTIEVSPPEVTYEERDGIKYQVTRQVVKSQVPTTVMQDRQETYYAPQAVTETITHQQTYSVPVTQYQTTQNLVNRWNPFATPYYTQSVEPVTTWQNQVTNVQIPVNKITWVQQTKTVQVPVTQFRTAEREIITRVAVTGNEAKSTQVVGTAPAASLVAGVYPTSPNTYRTATLTPMPGAAAPMGNSITASPQPPAVSGNWQTPPPNSRYR